MRPYAAAKGRSASTAASSASVRSGRPSTRASTSSPAPATANRTPAPSSGGMSSSPILIATQVLDQTTTSAEYRVQTSGRGTAREAIHCLFGAVRVMAVLAVVAAVLLATPSAQATIPPSVPDVQPG